MASPKTTWYVRLFNSLDNIPNRYWAWIVAKVLLVVWMLRYLTNVPYWTLDALGVVIFVVFSIASFGAIVSITGMFMSSQPSVMTQRVGPVLEIAGMSLLLAGPLVHALTLFGIVVLNEESTSSLREGPMWQSVAVVALIVVRIVEVFPRYKNENNK